MSQDRQLAAFAAFLEDRRAAYVASPDDRGIEITELDAVLTAFYATAMAEHDPVQRALVLARRDMLRTTADATA